MNVLFAVQLAEDEPYFKVCQLPFQPCEGLEVTTLVEDPKLFTVWVVQRIQYDFRSGMIVAWAEMDRENIRLSEGEYARFRDVLPKEGWTQHFFLRGQTSPPGVESTGSNLHSDQDFTRLAQVTSSLQVQIGLEIEDSDPYFKSSSVRPTLPLHPFVGLELTSLVECPGKHPAWVVKNVQFTTSSRTILLFAALELERTHWTDAELRRLIQAMDEDHWTQ